MKIKIVRSYNLIVSSMSWPFIFLHIKLTIFFHGVAATKLKFTEQYIKNFKNRLVQFHILSLFDLMLSLRR